MNSVRNLNGSAAPAKYFEAREIALMVFAWSMLFGESRGLAAVTELKTGKCRAFARLASLSSKSKQYSNISESSSGGRLSIEGAVARWKAEIRSISLPKVEYIV